MTPEQRRQAQMDRLKAKDWLKSYGPAELVFGNTERLARAQQAALDDNDDETADSIAAHERALASSDES